MGELPYQPQDVLFAFLQVADRGLAPGQIRLGLHRLQRHARELLLFFSYHGPLRTLRGLKLDLTEIGLLYIAVFGALRTAGASVSVVRSRVQATDRCDGHTPC